jgi:hypothetical protein
MRGNFFYDFEQKYAQSYEIILGIDDVVGLVD